VKRKAAAGEVSHKTKRPSYQERDWEEDEWEDDEDEGSVDVITVMTAVVGCVLLVVIAILAFKLYQQYVPKNYEKLQEQQESEEEAEEAQELDESSEDSETAVYTLTIVKNVNVRDNPSTSDTNILKVAQAGETYQCYGTAGDGTWYEIRLEDGTTGYVFQDYVSVE
jgi:flagellar biosynthesis/type III secretory pathway M-ring protein FliF/YscJ